MADSEVFPVTGDCSGARQEPLDKIDVTVPHSARIWNYWLGGKDNYEIDRIVGDKVAQINPRIREQARVMRAFLTRVIGYLAGEAGIRQFLDVGTGLPTVDNTHQIAQRLAPESRIVYVDNDRCKSGCVHAESTGTGARTLSTYRGTTRETRSQKRPRRLLASSDLAEGVTEGRDHWPPSQSGHEWLACNPRRGFGLACQLFIVRSARMVSAGVTELRIGWAVPGGHVEPDETSVEAALRELAEETGLVAHSALWIGALCEVLPPRYVPDPRASDEAWAVTVPVRVDLGTCDNLPAVTGGDDARRAEWIPADSYGYLADALKDGHAGKVFAAHVSMLREFLGGV
jgi:8-oxo-dGTP pyrophosphatase MutT (NUDIX family)